ncbi:hypothetical protein FHX40_1944 [Thermopolyspora flexuosa]|uniref:Uncharacterized protein n=1 Tax=Thermopolyspora flexuosa TaxID=103836 RepID=A0A543IXE2_9ACTN|nr:hypothetical protein FHX40_1944 [Thermopolyspora flexuosa]
MATIQGRRLPGAESSAARKATQLPWPVGQAARGGPALPYRTSGQESHWAVGQVSRR